jgi:hypothetical protein
MITAVNAQGRFDLKTRSGVELSNVPAENIRRPEDLPLNCRVTACLDELEWSLGWINEVSTDDTFSILFENGESETNVPRERIVKLEVRQFAVGARILGNWKGKGHLYPGTVAGITEAGHYNINYDDGDKEKDVPSDRLGPISLNVGDRIRGNWRSLGTLYPGQVTHVNESGNHDILYDDGDRELDVPLGRLVFVSPAPKPFDWLAYLAQTGSVAADASVFAEAEVDDDMLIWVPAKLKAVVNINGIDGAAVAIDNGDSSTSLQIPLQFIRLPLC